jgi:hypothetical protein
MHMTLPAARLRLALALFAAGLGAAACAGEPHGGGRGGRFGGMDAAERPSVIVRPGALLLEGMDANRDLAVTRAELDAAIDPLFAAADANHDGALSPVEFSLWSEKYLGTAEATPGRMSFDTNQNGLITKQEFTARLVLLFNEYDANHDGVVTRQELVQRLDIRSGPSTDGEGPSGERGERGGRHPGGERPGG